MAKHVTLSEIGKRAGVSNVAVGAALGLLAKDSSVRLGKAKAQMIRDVAKEMGYQPNLLARAFRRQETRMVGVLFRVASNPLSVGYLIDSTHRELLAKSYHAYLSPYQSNFDLMWANVLDLLAWRVDGLVLMHVFQTDDTQNKWHELESMLMDAGMPIVLVASDIATQKPQPRVNVDMEAVTFTATEHLLNLGHRHIGYVTHQSGPTPDRLAGMARATTAAAGSKVEAVCLEPASDGPLIQSLVRSAKATGVKLADRKDRPTGLICNNDIIAVGVIEGLRSRGVRVPQDVSVIGFDDSDYAVLIEPQLTTFSPPIEDMAKTAVDLLLEHIKDPNAKPKQVKFTAKLVVRDSTGPVAVKPAKPAKPGKPTRKPADAGKRRKSS